MKRLVKCIRGLQSLFDGNFTAGKVYEVVLYDYCFDTEMHCLLTDDEGIDKWVEDDCFEAINFDMETGKLKGVTDMKMVKCIVDSIRCYGDYDLGSYYLLVDEDDEGNIKVIDKNGKPYWEYNRHFVYQKAISELAVELGEEVLPTHIAERQGKSSKTIKE